MSGEWLPPGDPPDDWRDDQLWADLEEDERWGRFVQMVHERDPDEEPAVRQCDGCGWWEPVSKDHPWDEQPCPACRQPAGCRHLVSKRGSVVAMAHVSGVPEVIAKAMVLDEEADR